MHPDFVVNAGGIINVFYELEGYNRERALSHAEKIYDTTFKLVPIGQKRGHSYLYGGKQAGRAAH